MHSMASDSPVMKIRVAMIGCGAVGAIHAACLARMPGVELAAVYSPDTQDASSFAAKYGISRVCDSIQSAVCDADVAIVCSPSALHFGQARECLRAGLHTLIELPACGSRGEAEELGHEAEQRGVLLGCAHTARYLEPYAMIQSALEAGRIGEIQAISYVRYPRLRARSWTDNALRHHAAHAIDLINLWCGRIEPVACVATPDKAAPQSTSLLAKLPGGGPVSVTVSYEAKLPHSSMEVIGAKHSISTDGFSYLRSDLEGLYCAGEEQIVYEQGIEKQDAAFIAACYGKSNFVPWADTATLIDLIDRFEALCF